jgi:hypothetical protein
MKKLSIGLPSLLAIIFAITTSFTTLKKTSSTQGFDFYYRVFYLSPYMQPGSWYEQDVNWYWWFGYQADWNTTYMDLENYTDYCYAGPVYDAICVAEFNPMGQLVDIRSGSFEP